MHGAPGASRCVVDDQVYIAEGAGQGFCLVFWEIVVSGVIGVTYGEG